MYSNMLSKIQYYDFITCNIDLFSAGLCEQRRFRADAVPRDTRAIEDRGPVSKNQRKLENTTERGLYIAYIAYTAERIQQSGVTGAL